MQGFGSSKGFHFQPFGSHHSHQSHHSHHSHHSHDKSQHGTEIKPFFEPIPNQLYKITTVKDASKAFTIQTQGNNGLVLEEFKGLPNQTFNIYHSNGRYAFVSVFGNAALHVVGDSNDDGGKIKGDPSQHASSYFDLLPVTTGQWANKAAYIRTLSNKAVDIAGGSTANGTEILQWTYHGKDNQIWVISPVQQGQQGQQQGQQSQQGNQQVTQQFKFEPIPNQLYKVVTVKDAQKVFTVATGGNHVLTLEDYKGQQNQHFTIYLENGKYAFVSAFGNAALSIYQDNKANGGSIRADTGKHVSSFFEILPVTTGTWANKAAFIKTFSGKAVDINQNKAVNGAIIHQWDHHGGDNQIWLILPADQKHGSQTNIPQQNPHTSGFDWSKFQLPVQVIKGAAFSPVAGKSYKIAPVGNPSKVLDISQNFNSLGNALLWDFHGGANQRFVFEQNHGQFRIKNEASGNYLTIANDSPTDAALLRVDAPGKPSQIWEILPSQEEKFKGKGYVHFKTFSGKTLDIQGGQVVNDAHIIQNTFNGSGNQTWVITPI